MICTIQLISEKKDAKQKRPSTNDKGFLLMGNLFTYLFTMQQNKQSK